MSPPPSKGKQVKVFKDPLLENVIFLVLTGILGEGRPSHPNSVLILPTKNHPVILRDSGVLNRFSFSK